MSIFKFLNIKNDATYDVRITMTKKLEKKSLTINIFVRYLFFFCTEMNSSL